MSNAVPGQKHVDSNTFRACVSVCVCVTVTSRCRSEVRICLSKPHDASMPGNAWPG